jgi:hypothetical protein
MVCVAMLVFVEVCVAAAMILKHLMATKKLSNESVKPTNTGSLWLDFI